MPPRSLPGRDVKKGGCSPKGADLRDLVEVDMLGLMNASGKKPAPGNHSAETPISSVFRTRMSPTFRPLQIFAGRVSKCIKDLV